MKETEKRARVECLDLPWQVASSATNLQVLAVENDRCEIRVDTFWGSHSSEEARYRRVLIEFKPVAAVYTAALRGDDDRGGRERVDWASLECCPKDDAELGHWLAEQAKLWKVTGRAPDSHFYRIIGSRWVDEYRGHSLNHYLIRGGDAFVEVLSQGFRWSVVEMNPQEKVIWTGSIKPID